MKFDSGVCITSCWANLSLIHIGPM